MKIRAAALLLLYGALSLPAAAATVQNEIRTSLETPQSIAGFIGEPLYAPALLAQVYAARGYQPGWVSATEPDAAVSHLLEAIDRSRDDGLQPADYHLHALHSLLAALQTPESFGALRNRQLAAVELLCSDAFLLLGEHESSGRLEWPGLRPRTGVDLHQDQLTHALSATMGGADPLTQLAGMLPADATYVAMRDQLARYRKLASELPAGEIPAGATLHPGEQSAAIPRLIARLQAAGDLSAADAAQAHDRFDPALVAAVKQFQQRHGLAVDGILGDRTLAALNRQPQQVADALRVNMERWRWLPHPLAPTRVMVNIAGFNATFYLLDRPTLVARVIVGQVGKQTPEFIDRIRYLVVNPSWDVPPSIAGEELLPKIQADPEYPAKHGYEVLEGWGPAERSVDPLTVDWKRFTTRTLSYHFRQAPGPENPLGRIKFVFPNRYDVYMHDTPSQGLFQSSQCTFSHGCIRVSNAMQLAAALLKLDGMTDPAGFLAREAATGETRRIDLLHPVYIYIVYLTAWVDQSGLLEMRPDVYTRDPKVLRALNIPLAERGVCCSDSVLP